MHGVRGVPRPKVAVSPLGCFTFPVMFFRKVAVHAERVSVPPISGRTAS